MRPVPVSQTIKHGFSQLLTVVLFLCCTNVAYASLDLIIENNTGATLTVTNYFNLNDYDNYRESQVAPVKIIVLRDFLSHGRNEIRITAPCSSIQKEYVKGVWVSEGATKQHKISVDERDFDVVGMSDRPGCKENAKQVNTTVDIVGIWDTKQTHKGCTTPKSYCQTYPLELSFSRDGAGNVITGWADYTLKGKLSGTRYTFDIYHGKSPHGKGEFDFSSDFRDFEGTWEDKYKHRGIWVGHKK